MITNWQCFPPPSHEETTISMWVSPLPIRRDILLFATVISWPSNQLTVHALNINSLSSLFLLLLLLVAMQSRSPASPAPLCIPSFPIWIRLKITNWQCSPPPSHKETAIRVWVSSTPEAEEIYCFFATVISRPSNQLTIDALNINPLSSSSPSGGNATQITGLASASVDLPCDISLPNNQGSNMNESLDPYDPMYHWIQSHGSMWLDLLVPMFIDSTICLKQTGEGHAHTVVQGGPGRAHLQVGPKPISGVKLLVGSKALCVFCFETCTREGKGRKGRECKFQNKAHWTSDPWNNFPPVHQNSPSFQIKSSHTK